MSAVLILRGGKPNKLARAANRADGPWFAAHPDRNHYVRQPVPMERMQAVCLHGLPHPNQDWFIAARRSAFGLIERRFFSMTAGRCPDFDEATARWNFDGAMIAGAAPQHEPEPTSPEAA